MDYVVLPVCERSQSNCPWSSNLCVLHIEALQMFTVEGEEDKTTSKIKGKTFACTFLCLSVVLQCCTFLSSWFLSPNFVILQRVRRYFILFFLFHNSAVLEKRLSYSMELGNEAVIVWMAYLIYLRRQIKWDQNHETELRAFRGAAQQAINMIDKCKSPCFLPRGVCDDSSLHWRYCYWTGSVTPTFFSFFPDFGEEGDIDSEIPRFWARIEAEFVHDQESAREIWNDIVLKRNNNFKNANLWLEFVILER